MEIIVSNEIENVCPNFIGACVEAKVKNSQYCQDLWNEINTLGEEFKNKHRVLLLLVAFIAFVVKTLHAIARLPKL